MSLTSYESDIKRINADEVSVFALLSDLSRLEALKDKLPTDKVKEAYFDADSVRLKVDMLGEVGMRIILREPYKTIKFQAENSPFEVYFWIQIKQVAPNDTRIKLTLKAELPTMIKMMVGNKIQEGINQIADILTRLPY
ncbi:MAG: SRPBCC family protein [Paludibacteraceae bacterium]|nr:SRPBCC family protein [Paludibacteraceae bacterium]